MELFLSYSWNDDKIVDSIESALNEYNIIIHRDKKEVKLTDNITSYIKTINKYPYVLILITDSFLKSKYCMFEVLEKMKDNQYINKIIPVIHNIDLNRAGIDIEYVQYWQEERDRFKKQMKNINDIENIANDDLRIFRQIEGEISEFIKEIKSIRYTTFKEIQNNDYESILEKIGVPLETRLAVCEKKLYNTILIDEIVRLNNKRIGILQGLNEIKHLKLLLDRRFKFSISVPVKSIVNNLLTNNDFENSDLQHLTKIGSNNNFQNWIDSILDNKTDKYTCLISGHFLIDYIEKEKRPNLTSEQIYIEKYPNVISEQILEILLDSPTNSYQLEIIVEIITKYRDFKNISKIEEILNKKINIIEGIEETEAYASLCNLLKTLDYRKFIRHFTLAHYKLLKFRSNFTKTYKYPLLVLHQGLVLNEDDYNYLLEGGFDQQMAAIWSLSFFGGVVPMFAEKNDDIIELSPPAKANFLELTKKKIDYQDKWRLCNAAVKTNAVELLPWLMEQSTDKEMISKNVKINHPTHGVIEEPESAMLLRTCGYFARLLRDTGDVQKSHICHTFLKRKYEEMSLRENSNIRVAISTGLGFLGEWEPILSCFVQEKSEPWLKIVLYNIIDYWISTDEKTKFKKWIDSDRLTISEGKRKILDEISKSIDNSILIFSEVTQLTPPVRKDCKQELIELLQNNDVELVFSKLHDNGCGTKALVLTTYRYKSLQIDFNNGLIDYKTKRLEENQIISYLLELIYDCDCKNS